MPLLITNREFVVRNLTFTEEDGSLVMAIVPDDAVVDYGARMRKVRAKSTAIMRVSPLPGNTQCEVTFIQHLDAGGLIPDWVAERSVPRSLKPVVLLRNLFQRDSEIDRARWDQLARTIRANRQTYSKDEKKMTKSVYDKFSSLGSEMREIESPDHFVGMKFGTRAADAPPSDAPLTRSPRTRAAGFAEGTSNGIGRASTIIDADICTCAAWDLHRMSRGSVARFYANGGLERSLLEHNEHDFTFHTVQDYKIPTFTPREAVMRGIWWWESEKVLLVAVKSYESHEFPHRPEYVRGTLTMLSRFEEKETVGGIPQTHLTWTQQPNPGGLIPKSLLPKVAIGRLM
jgi:hypothetical protein